VGWGLG
jgi:hypothetical protein